MHIIAKKTLLIFWQKHPTAESPLKSWFSKSRHAHWGNLAELKQDFPSADLVGRLIVFNIGGGNYRLIFGIEYELQRIYIRHILTRAEYDKERWKHDDGNA